MQGREQASLGMGEAEGLPFLTPHFLLLIGKGMEPSIAE